MLISKIQPIGHQQARCPLSAHAADARPTLHRPARRSPALAMADGAAAAAPSLQRRSRCSGEQTGANDLGHPDTRCVLPARAWQAATGARINPFCFTNPSTVSRRASDPVRDGSNRPDRDEAMPKGCQSHVLAVQMGVSSAIAIRARRPTACATSWNKTAAQPGLPSTHRTHTTSWGRPYKHLTRKFA